MHVLGVEKEPNWAHSEDHPKIRKLEKAVAVSGVCSGVPEENSGKVTGKLPEKNVPESQHATNSRISGTGKGKPSGNLGSTLPRPCSHLPSRGVFFFAIDSSMGSQHPSPNVKKI